MLNISSCWWIVVIRLVRGKLLLLGVCSHNSFRNSVSDQDHIHVTKGPMVHSLTALKAAPSTLVLKFQVILCKQVWSEAILHIVALEYSSFSSLRLCWLLSPTHLLLSLNLDHLHHHWHHFFFFFLHCFPVSNLSPTHRHPPQSLLTRSGGHDSFYMSRKKEKTDWLTSHAWNQQQEAGRDLTSV